jgi:hypothetical protein
MHCINAQAILPLKLLARGFSSWIIWVRNS